MCGLHVCIVHGKNHHGSIHLRNKSDFTNDLLRTLGVGGTDFCQSPESAIKRPREGLEMNACQALSVISCVFISEIRAKFPNLARIIHPKIP